MRSLGYLSIFKICVTECSLKRLIGYSYAPHLFGSPLENIENHRSIMTPPREVTADNRLNYYELLTQPVLALISGSSISQSRVDRFNPSIATHTPCPSIQSIVHYRLCRGWLYSICGVIVRAPRARRFLKLARRALNTPGEIGVNAREKKLDSPFRF